MGWERKKEKKLTYETTQRGEYTCGYFGHGTREISNHLLPALLVDGVFWCSGLAVSGQGGDGLA